MVPLAEGEPKRAVRTEGEHLVRIPIGEQDEVVLVDRHVVDVGNLPPSPRTDELAGGIEDEDRRIGAPVADVHEALGIDDEVAHETERLAPRTACTSAARPDTGAHRAQRRDALRSFLPPSVTAGGPRRPFARRPFQSGAFIGACATLDLSLEPRLLLPCPTPGPALGDEAPAAPSDRRVAVAGGLPKVAVEMHPPQVERRKDPGPPGPERPQATGPLRTRRQRRRRWKVLQARKPLNGHLNRPRDRRCAAMPQHPHGRAAAPCPASSGRACGESPLERTRPPGRPRPLRCHRTRSVRQGA